MCLQRSSKARFALCAQERGLLTPQLKLQPGGPTTFIAKAGIRDITSPRVRPQLQIRRRQTVMHHARVERSLSPAVGTSSHRQCFKQHRFLGRPRDFGKQSHGRRHSRTPRTSPTMVQFSVEFSAGSYGLRSCIWARTYAGPQDTETKVRNKKTRCLPNPAKAPISCSATDMLDARQKVSGLACEGGAALWAPFRPAGNLQRKFWRSWAPVCLGGAALRRSSNF